MWNKDEREEQELQDLTKLDKLGGLTLNPTSTLEGVFGFPFFLSVLGLGFGFFWLFLASAGMRIEAPPPISPGNLILFSLLLLPVGCFLHRQADVHYQVRPDTGDILYFRRIFSQAKTARIGRIEDIYCVTPETDFLPQTSGERRHRKPRLRHGLLLILKTGRRLRVCDPTFNSQALVEQYGRRLARDLGVDFIDGWGRLTVKKTRAGIELSRLRRPGPGYLEAVPAGCALIVILLIALKIGTAVIVSKLHPSPSIQQKTSSAKTRKHTPPTKTTTPQSVKVP